MDQHRPDHTIAVTIQTGRGAGEFTFVQQTKVAEAIQVAIEQFGFPAGDGYILVRASTNEQLQPERSLVSYQIADGEILILSAIGSGV
jgi:hypothetical protein